MNDCPTCDSDIELDELLPPTTHGGESWDPYVGLTCPECGVESDYTKWGLNALYD